MNYPAELLILKPSGDTRKSPRYRTRIAAGDFTSALARKVTLTDVSQQGCRLKCEGGLQAGDEIWLRLAGSGMVRATIAWTRDGQAGLTFGTPFSQARIESLAAGDDVVKGLTAGRVPTAPEQASSQRSPECDPNG